LAQGGENLVVFGVAPRRFLREDRLPTEGHLEGPSPGGDDRDLRDLVLELGQNALRQTDGSRRVASLNAIIDDKFHRRAVYALRLTAQQGGKGWVSGSSSA
jgi:hypothetical protein